MIGSRSVRAALSGVIWLALATSVWGAATPSPQTISITADAMDVDAVARVVTATGHVRVSDGVYAATAQRATFYQREGRGVLSGGARVVGPAGVLAGSEVTITYAGKAITRLAARGSASLESSSTAIAATTVAIVLADGVVTAVEGVRVTSAPDVIATGDRLVYHRAREAATLEGRARLENRDGVIAGERIEGTARWERAVVSGPVWGRFRNIEIRSQSAEVVRLERKAVFAGDVQIMQPGRLLLTDRATVWYGTGRIVAEGQTRVRLETPP